MNSPITYKNRVLYLHNESVAYEGSVALRSISVSILRGEKVALVGPSGAGKTTLLRRFYQLKPDKCAFIHQHYSLVPQLNTFHNIYMGQLNSHSLFTNLRNLIKPSPRFLEEIRPIAERLGISDKLHTRVGELSGGQQQRVGIGRALYHGGDILMADEPVSSLDEVQQKEIMGLITATSKTVVSSLHSLELARLFFNRVIGLKNQSILFDSPTENVTGAQLADLYGSQ